MNKIYNKAIFKYIVPVIMLCFSVLWIEPITVHAEEEFLYNDVYSTISDSPNNHNTIDYRIHTFSLSTNEKPFLFGYVYHGSSAYIYNFFMIFKESPFCLSSTNINFFTDGHSSEYSSFSTDVAQVSLSNTGDGASKITYNDESYIIARVSFSVGSTNFVKNVFENYPLFNCDTSTGPSFQSGFNKYIEIVENGLQPDSGSYFTAIPGTEEPLGPGLELVKHNFSQDIITPDIPVPQLTKISHEGFTLGNRGDYSAEVIVESDLLGVKFESQTIGMGMSSPWHFVPDSNWVYQSFYYNIADSSEVLIGTDEVNIKELYGFDNISNLITAYKYYGETYPKANTLPSYTWLKSGWNHIYVQDHVYDSASEKSDYEQLVGSGQARTSYYVRYVSSDGSTGQWVKYSFQDAYGTINNGMVYEGSLNVGVVEPDVNGNPVLKDEVSGSVNYENGGSIQYTPPASSTVPTVNQSELDTSLSGFQSTLEQFGSSTATVAKFTTEMFGFLPGWCTALIGLGITGVVILRFLGR